MLDDTYTWTQPLSMDNILLSKDDFDGEWMEFQIVLFLCENPIGCIHVHRPLPLTVVFIHG